MKLSSKDLDAIKDVFRLVLDEYYQKSLNMQTLERPEETEENQETEEKEIYKNDKNYLK